MLNDDDRFNMLDSLALNIPCPRCGAFSEDKCRTLLLGTETFPHMARVDRAVQAHFAILTEEVQG